MENHPHKGDSPRSKFVEGNLERLAGKREEVRIRITILKKRLFFFCAKHAFIRVTVTCKINK